jgi:Tfp pilus assembly protein PilO
MKVRDRLVVAVIAAVVVVGAVWVILVSPERSKTSALDTQISTEQTALTQAQTGLDNARDAVSAYVGHVHQIDAVMRAVPTGAGEAQLIRTIVKLAGTKVDFRTLGVSSGGATSAGPVSLDLSFSFKANYGNLQSFLSALDALTTTDGSSLNANGRLFTIQSVSLAPTPPNSTTASIMASVYQQSLSAPVGATSPTGVTAP